jgi:hypothetical protein
LRPVVNDFSSANKVFELCKLKKFCSQNKSKFNVVFSSFIMGGSVPNLKWSATRERHETQKKTTKNKPNNLLL